MTDDQLNTVTPTGRTALTLAVSLQDIAALDALLGRMRPGGVELEPERCLRCPTTGQPARSIAQICAVPLSANIQQLLDDAHARVTQDRLRIAALLGGGERLVGRMFDANSKMAQRTRAARAKRAPAPLPFMTLPHELVVAYL